MAFQYTVSVNDPTNSPKAGALGAVVTAAAAQWSRWIRGGGTLDIQVNVATTSVGRANGGAATSTYVGMDGSRLVYENGTISELRSGRDPNGAAPDVIITVDPNYLSTLWLDANSVAPANMTDGLSVFMHEIGHALGMQGWRSPTDGSLPNYESTWDRLVVVNGDHTASFVGTHAVANFGGPVPVTSLSNGQQYNHLFNSETERGGQDLMNGIVFRYATRYDISTLDLAIMQDLGMRVALYQTALSDVNGDGTSDLLFQQGGSIVSWQAQNGQVQAATGLGNAGSYQVVGTGDVTGDGTSDVLFQQGASVVAWRMQNGQVQAATSLGSAGGYQVVGTGDLNGDGTSDVLFQQGSSVVAWRMQNGQVQSSSGLGNAGNYQVVGTGDLNGDGTDDIVFQDGAAVAAWIMGNGQVQSVANLGNAGGYRVEGVGDLNGDGRADLVFQNGASVVEWIMGSNGQVQSASGLGNAGGYAVSGVGDYTGDGTADVLFQQGASVVGWQVQNGQVQSLLNLGNAGAYTAVS
jgi:hypothetical protein